MDDDERTDLDIDLVTAENDGDRLADSLEVSVPVGNVLVGDFGSDIEHDDTTLSLHASRQYRLLVRVDDGALGPNREKKT